MPSSTMIHVRVDKLLKAEATATLATMGLTVSEAVRVLLTKVVAEQKLPFDLRVPRAQARAAIAEAQVIGRARKEAMDALIESLRKARREKGGTAPD